MPLLDDLVGKYAAVDLEDIFNAVEIASNKIHPANRPALKEVTLAQWLLESARATSKLAVEATNFAGLKWRDEMKGFAKPILIKVPSEPELVEFCKFENVEAFLVGYWKFLTRPVYKGLEDHTKTPETFIGFLFRKNFAADPGYVNKVMKLLPEAQQLLGDANRISRFSQPEPTFQVNRIPQEVSVGQSFRVEGVAAPADSGKVLLIEVDDQFKTKGATIGADGKWQFDFVLNQAGDRKIEIFTDQKTIALKVRAVQPVSDARGIDLIGSVGARWSK